MAPMVVGKTVVIQSGSHGSFIGRLDLIFEDGRVSGHRHALIPLDDTLEEESGTARLVADALKAGDELARVVGETPRDLHRLTCLDAPMDDVLLAAIARAAGTEVAFSNGWRYGAPVPAGLVTVGDLWNIIPVDPVVSMVDLKGAEILSMMEESLERTFSCDPFEQRGGCLKALPGNDPPRQTGESAGVQDRGRLLRRRGARHRANLHGRVHH